MATSITERVAPFAKFIFLACIIAAILVIILVIHQKRDNGMRKITRILKKFDNCDDNHFVGQMTTLLIKNNFKAVGVPFAKGTKGVDLTARYKGEKCAFHLVHKDKISNNVTDADVKTVIAPGQATGSTRIIVVTNSYFNQPAKDAAKHAGVELWDRDRMKRLIEYGY